MQRHPAISRMDFNSNWPFSRCNFLIIESIRFIRNEQIASLLILTASEHIIPKTLLITSL